MRTAGLYLLKALGVIAAVIGAAFCSLLLTVLAFEVSWRMFGAADLVLANKSITAVGGLIAGVVIAIRVFKRARKHGFGTALVVTFFMTPWIVFAGTIMIQFSAWLVENAAKLF